MWGSLDRDRHAAASGVCFYRLESHGRVRRQLMVSLKWLVRRLWLTLAREDPAAAGTEFEACLPCAATKEEPGSFGPGYLTIFGSALLPECRHYELRPVSVPCDSSATRARREGSARIELT